MTGQRLRDELRGGGEKRRETQAKPSSALHAGGHGGKKGPANKKGIKIKEAGEEGNAREGVAC